MPETFFNSSTGIRQGDPISPFLFIIMAETFGRAIEKAYLENKISRVSITEDVNNITHQKFTNEKIIVGISNLNEAIIYKEIISTYMRASGQKVNEEKLEIFFLNTKMYMENNIYQTMRYRKGTFPYKYMDIQIEKGSRIGKSWDPIIEKIEKKINNWKSRWLTKAGRVNKIKLVLLAIPTYPITFLPFPKAIKQKIDHKLRDFFGKGIEEKKK